MSSPPLTYTSCVDHHIVKHGTIAFILAICSFFYLLPITYYLLPITCSLLPTPCSLCQSVYLA
ncbi:hypothetical protein [Moorena sp. SIO4G3]|uniref:hypothetical protein n=1 Tax=Moorena sp. SIO4G3 TaxID=2607821 RepID=UPI00142A52B9|nr:hypothetical protein [Moorena sp. SIO4G3]NEO77095.1 hypothetical protein [Moorena sp. SIO4G3]